MTIMMKITFKVLFCCFYSLLLSTTAKVAAFSSSTTVQQLKLSAQNKNHRQQSLSSTFEKPSAVLNSAYNIPTHKDEVLKPTTALFAFPSSRSHNHHESVAFSSSGNVRFGGSISSSRRHRRLRQQKSLLFSSTTNNNHGSTSNTTTVSRSVVKKLRTGLTRMILIISLPFRKLKNRLSSSKDNCEEDNGKNSNDSMTANLMTPIVANVDTNTAGTSHDIGLDAVASLVTEKATAANDRIESFQQNIKHSLEMMAEPINNLKHDTMEMIAEPINNLKQDTIERIAEPINNLKQDTINTFDAVASTLSEPLTTPTAPKPASSTASSSSTMEQSASKESAPSVVASTTISSAVIEKEKTSTRGNTAAAATVDAATAVPVGDRWAISHPDVDLSGEWNMIVTDEFKKDYDEYLKQLGQPMIVRSVAVGIISMTTEETKQLDQGRKLWIRGVNARGVWERTLEASGTCYQRHSHDPETDATLVPVETADSETVVAESWWEDQGTVHRSWLRGGVKYGGGDFESKRYLEQDGKVLVCESTFHPKDTTRAKAKIAWRFLRTGESL